VHCGFDDEIPITIQKVDTWAELAGQADTFRRRKDIVPTTATRAGNRAVLIPQEPALKLHCIDCRRASIAWVDVDHGKP
jgi:hypothetical protein